MKICSILQKKYKMSCFFCHSNICRCITVRDLYKDSKSKGPIGEVGPLGKSGSLGKSGPTGKSGQLAPTGETGSDRNYYKENIIITTAVILFLYRSFC